MPDTFTTITNFINSPPGQVAAGSVLFGTIWTFFERVESLLTDKTKLEIAVWLVGVKVGEKIKPWPETFAKMFDRVFGVKHLSWNCFWRSCLLSCVVQFVTCLLSFERDSDWSFIFLSALVINIVPDYLSLLKTRYMIGRLANMSLTYRRGLILDFVTSVGIFVLWAIVIYGIALGVTLLDQPGASSGFASYRIIRGAIAAVVTSVFLVPYSYGLVILIPLLATSIWIWLYVGSGLVIKFARRFDIGFQWFNSKFDIENKPLQSIGLVAGVLVALLYWTAAAIRHIV